MPKPKHPVMHPLDRLPEGHELGGLKPKIKNRSDLSLALRVISWIVSRRQTLQAALDQKIDLLREQAKGDMQLEVGKHTVTFDDRETALRAACEAYADVHRADIFPEGTKTAKFPSGTIAFRDIAPSLQFDEEVSRKSIEGQLISEHGLIAKGINWLKRQGVLPWLKLTISLDVAGIGRAIKAGQISDEQLAELGMRWEGDEKFSIDPHEYIAAADGPVAATDNDQRMQRASA